MNESWKVARRPLTRPARICANAGYSSAVSCEHNSITHCTHSQHLLFMFVSFMTASTGSDVFLSQLFYWIQAFHGITSPPSRVHRSSTSCTRRLYHRLQDSCQNGIHQVEHAWVAYLVSYQLIRNEPSVSGVLSSTSKWLLWPLRSSFSPMQLAPSQDSFHISESANRFKCSCLSPLLQVAH